VKSPRVSICIPTYRQIDYLLETLRSVKAQDFDDYELIISDDTPDDTVQQFVTAFGFDDRLRYYHNPIALGSPKNWNVAVRYAQGEYIKLLHHDDRFSHPSALGIFVRLLDEHPEADFAFSASSAVNMKHGYSHCNCPSKELVAQLVASPENLFLGNIIGAPSATIYRNGLSVEYDCNLQWLVDVDFYIRVLLKNSQLVYTPEVLIVAATNASHQITELCKNNVTIDLFEHLYLYQKVATQLSDNSNVQYVWFRLFEKYQVYSQIDLKQQGVDLFALAEMLQLFFEDYREVRLKRTPHRIYAHLPNPLKHIIKFLFTR
jgi:glycosyltransferase involved in cell wall biosynthesis